MNFNEILEADGLYVAKSFTEGTAFLVEQGMLHQVHYKNASDFMPSRSLPAITLSVVNKDYAEVFNRQSLFGDKRKNLFQ